MKWLAILMAAFMLVACSDKKDDKDKKPDMYKTPPPSDRSKDKGF
jgi:hypothetical protein